MKVVQELFMDTIGQLMENPYTDYRTEPMDGVAATPGQTGYMAK
jgi:hypothetical protein